MLKFDGRNCIIDGKRKGHPSEEEGGAAKEEKSKEGFSGKEVCSVGQEEPKGALEDRDLHEVIEVEEKELSLSEQLQKKLDVDEVSEFSADGVARVRSKDKNTYSLINEAGKNITGKEYLSITGDFVNQDVAMSVTLDNKQQLINSSGEVLAELPEGHTAFITGPTDGKTIVWDKTMGGDDDKYFLNGEGKIPGRKKDEEGHYYYETLNGRKVSRIDDIKEFNSGIAQFKVKAGLAGFMNDKGEVVAFDIMNPINLGAGLVKFEEDGIKKVMNASGDIIAHGSNLDAISATEDGLVEILGDGADYFVDKEGNRVEETKE